MKDYKDVARSVFRRRDIYLKEKKRKRDTFMKRSAVALSCCLMMLVGFNIWRTDSLKTIAPSPDKSQFNVTEANTTAPPTTDENGMTAIPVTTDSAVTTAPDHSGKPVQNVTTATTASGGSLSNITTTRAKGSSSGDVPLPTTFSFMEVTAVRHTSAVTTTATTKTTAVKTTTAKSNDTKSTTLRTTTHNNKTTTANTTTRHTTLPTSTTTYATYTTTRYYTTTIYYSTTNTRPVQTTSAVYSTTRSYTTTAQHTSTTRRTTSVHYTTSKIYTTTSYAGDNPVATGNPEPIVLTTTSITTTTVVYTYTTTTSLTGFHRNGNYYKTTGTRQAKEFLTQSIGSEYDENIDKTFYIYAYEDIDPDFMCYAYTDGYYAYLGINEVWTPSSLNDLVTGMRLDKYLEGGAFYEYATNDYELLSINKVIDTLNDYGGLNTNVTGVSENGARYLKETQGVDNSGEKLTDIRASVYIAFKAVDYSSYYHYGYIYITDDGKLHFDLLYLRYTYDIGTENAEELVNKLKTL